MTSTRALAAELHHYTTIQAVHGILSPGVIWATSVEYLNDTTEVDYCINIAVTLIDEEIKSRKGQFAINDHLFRVRHELVQHRARSNYFVTCFCEVTDLLSQWRAYGQNGGFSVDFDASKLEASVRHLNGFDSGVIDPKMERACYFEKVIYDSRIQCEIIRIVLRCCIEAYDDLLSKNSIDEDTFIKLVGDQDFKELVNQFARYTAKKLLRFVTLFKHPAFAEEKEWRMVHSRNADDCENLMFRPGKGRLIPYTEVKIDMESCLTSVTCGPPFSPLSGQSLYVFLKSLGLQEKQILGTSAPLRR